MKLPCQALLNTAIHISSSTSTGIKLYTQFTCRAMASSFSLAKEIISSGIAAVSPSSMVADTLKIYKQNLMVEQRMYMLNKNVYVVAFGKAVYGMVKTSADILGEHLVKGVASVPHGIKDVLLQGEQSNLNLSVKSKVEIIEGARHNVPDEHSLRAAHAIADLVKGLTEQDILLVLVSGGGSALLPFPKPTITLEDKQGIIRELTSRGVPIQEVNTIRKHLSQLKGGKLAQLAHPAKVISLILSDIIGDPLDLIASGPTVPDTSTISDCKAILKKYIPQNNLLPSVIEALETTNQGRESISDFSHVQNIIVGSNTIAVRSAERKAIERNLKPIVLSTCVEGEASVVGRYFAKLANQIVNLYKDQNYPLDDLKNSLINLNICNHDEIVNKFVTTAKLAKPVCVLGAGETTVTLNGSGKGGRNQEMALAAAIEMDNWCEEKPHCRVVFLSAGTDGQDGPTDAAGAIAYPSLVKDANNYGINPHEYLHDNNSYSFYDSFRGGLCHLKTGLTGTNVMDLYVMIVSPDFS